MSTQGAVVWESHLDSADSSLLWDLFRQPAGAWRGDVSGPKSHRSLMIIQATLWKTEGAGQGGESPAEGCTAGSGSSASLSLVDRL